MRLSPLLACVCAGLSACAFVGSTVASAQSSRMTSLVGAWRSKVQFSSGPFAAVKDLEFLFVFNEGGTMTESSNYDGAPPVPPAYGVWRKTAPREYELHYEYFNSTPPKALEDMTGGGGWTPGGRGTIKERIKLSADGRTFTSTISFVLRDTAGKEIPGGGAASSAGTRMTF